MTTTAPRTEGAPQQEHPRAAASAHGRRGVWTRRRVELRLAVRQARRAWPTSLLVISLIAIPMMLISAAATFASSRVVTPAETMASELGSTQSWLMIIGGEDSTRTQIPAQPYSYDVARDEDGTPLHAELPPPTGLNGLIDQADLLTVAHAQVRAQTSTGVQTMTGFVGDAVDPRLDGRYELVEGRRPADATETAVSPGALARLHAQVGDMLALIEPAASLTIVGVMKQSTHSDREQFLFLPGGIVAADDLDAAAERIWFAPQWEPSASELTELNRSGVIVYGRDAVVADGTVGEVSASSAWSLLMVGVVVAVFTAYLVVLLAGAGVAVSARRQQRSLAIVASVGANRASVFRIVLLQGTVLGIIGGVLGAIVGVGLAYPALLVLDDGAMWSFPGFHVPWAALVGVVLFAVLVGTASALVPARAATRGDVLASLRGSRKPVALRANLPVWGSLLGIVGLALTVAGGLGLAASNASPVVDYGDPVRTLCLVAIVAGPVLLQFGAILAGHWILSAIARGTARLGPAPRIAARDAAANPGRIVPAFAAIAASVFIASFALTGLSVFTEYSSRSWWYQAPLGSVVVAHWPDDAEDSHVFDDALAALERSGPATIGIVEEHIERLSDSEDEPVIRTSAEVVDYVACDDIPQGECTTPESALFWGASPVVVAPQDLDTVIGTAVDAPTRAAFADGGAIVLDPSYLDGGEVVLNQWDADEVDHIHDDPAESAPLPEPVATTRVKAALVEPRNSVEWIVILSPRAADSVGYDTVPTRAVGAYTAPLSAPARSELVLAGDASWQVDGFSVTLEEGPPSSAPWLWLILGAAAVLVLGAGSVALGLARVERRPDDATLAAVGATGGIRRRIAFWQAIIIVGVGSVTGTIAGIVPVWGIVMQSASWNGYSPSMSDAPWPWLVLLAVGLPLAIGAVSWLLPTRRPDLTRRTMIA